NVYLAGYTDSPTGIASGGYQNTPGGITDAFLVKFDAAGNRLWATYFGGAFVDFGNGITCDASGNVCLAGWTNSTAGIASGGFQNTYGGGFGTWDAYLAKFDAAGALLWSTYYGSTGIEYGYSASSDLSGNIYLAGFATSTTGISSAGFQMTNGGGGDAFIVKFDAAGNRLWGTYYGGSAGELAYCAAADPSGNVYLTGMAASTTGISSAGFQNFLGGTNDAFLVKFDVNGNRLWGTYYGGFNTDYAFTVATDPAGNVYIGGDTYSLNGIASAGFQNNLAGTENEFVVMFDSSGNRRCATYYGQTHDEDGHIALDGNGNVYLSGYTYSVSGIASGGFQNNYGGGGADAYLVKFYTCCSAFTADADSTNAACDGTCDGTATVTPASGTNPYTYSWTTIPAQTTQTATGLCPGTFSVTITDSIGCTKTQSVTVVMETGPLAAASASTYSISSGGNSQLSATGGGAYQWTPVSGLSCSACQNPVASPTVTTSYCVLVTDTNGCSDSACVVIFVDMPCGGDYLSTMMPNAFSPDNNGQNDQLCIPQGPCIVSASISIYDRWGEKVFETDDKNACWDGIHKGQALNAAVFVYSLEGVFTNGESFKQTGNISLVR
ncbi:MAG TPA: SBBP repeat-containing protein, partial [Bacteroidia bacterium]|nr:SBBP repeat-containing protein [Bacteroidia bacterium]